MKHVVLKLTVTIRYLIHSFTHEFFYRFPSRNHSEAPPTSTWLNSSFESNKIASVRVQRGRRNSKGSKFQTTGSIMKNAWDLKLEVFLKY